MNTLNKNKSERQFTIGIVLLVIGMLFILRNFGLLIPFWVLSWHTVMLAIGLLIGYKRNFKPGGWVLLTMIGGIFTLKDIVSFDMTAYTGALVLIGLGLYMIFKPKHEHHFCGFDHKKGKLDFDDLKDQGK
ncbi:LiaF transmembrane domain-containing protein [Pedobacter metabolipauper]|uniref:LiaF transmembrane domain-containing protein n=1 Tax=Pedobacter metabolipauper TaxID=425513 RepID=A0A4V3D0Z0_9SPHI|nr:hypothetical protein [Pedobacter metabolipauper]TDQ08354.1 hypothetical protein ATK78_2866 [Pedobacter metabolipauper]